MTNPVDTVAAHVARTRTADLPPEAVRRVKTFLLDTLGVGIAGSSGAQVSELIEVARGWGAEPEASVLATGERMSAGSAAVVNAYQIHCLEYDCVHERAVLHPMATVLAAVMAWAERESGRGRPVRGEDLIAALAVGIDVSTMLGIATNAGLRFFRPALAGGFGAAAAIANLARMGEAGVKDALGAQYAQASGTLQPHVEGSPMLGMQVGLNARAAICSADLARAGFRGPHDILVGQYGYFRLFEEGDHDVEAFVPTLGRDWQVLRMSHKPYPSGRLTHGAIDGLGRLIAEHGFGAGDIAAVRVEVPPLVHRLVGRPVIAEPEANYAKLCLRHVAGLFLARGGVDVPDFRGEEALRDADLHRYAALVDVVLDGNPDQNALTPQTIAVTLADGSRHAVTLPEVYGHPDKPLTDEENVAKFRRCAAFSRAPLAEPDAVIDGVASLEAVEDVAELMALSRGAAA